MRPIIETFHAGLLGRVLRRLGGLLAAVLALGLPAVAAACPVCYSAGENGSRWAYYGMTIFLSLMPFLLMGLLGLWVRRAYFKISGKAPAPR